MRVALDTNLLVYAEGANDSIRHETAVSLVDSLSRDAIVVPVQVLGELFNVLVRKAGMSRSEVRDIVLRWQTHYDTIPTTPDVLTTAMNLAVDHHFRIWDAVILAAASRAECRLLLSEDMQHGFMWNGVTVVNPFLSQRHWLLENLLAQGDR